MEAELGGDHVVETVGYLVVEVFFGKVWGNGVESVGSAHISPFSLILLERLTTKIGSEHITDPTNPPLENILPPSTSNIKYMQNLIEFIALFEI